MYLAGVMSYSILFYFMAELGYGRNKRSETVSHYLSECDLYDEARERLRTALYLITGSIQIDLDTLLSLDDSEINKNNHHQILQLLDRFISETGRFKNTPSFIH